MVTPTQSLSVGRVAPSVSFGVGVKALTFLAASYLTDPICKVHETLARLCVFDTLCPDLPKVQRFAHKLFLILKIVFFAALSLATTLPGAVLRSLGANLESIPYLHIPGSFPEKATPSSFTLHAWNICSIGAGYSLLESGVMPWADRIEKIAQNILTNDADVVCLYEVFDIQTATYLRKKLHDRYSHFYYNMGARTIGTSSGLFVASRFCVERFQFTPLPKEMLVGLSQFCQKGIASFELSNAGDPFATVLTTHLQHSEINDHPTQAEKEARSQSLQRIADQAKEAREKVTIITGDFNANEEELAASALVPSFQESTPYTDKTWGGDRFCAERNGKIASSASNLDHTLVRNGSCVTTLTDTGFEAEKLQAEALSDHRGLLSLITL